MIKNHVTYTYRQMKRPSQQRGPLRSLSAACSERGGSETRISASGHIQTITSKTCLPLECAVKEIH